MYKAASELVKARQPYTEYIVEQVFVKQLGGGIANQCFQNATDDELLAKGNKVVSGWIVNAYDKANNSTEIVQHWWNIDSNGNYFDLTPDVDGTMEYIIDTDIVAYGQENFDNLDNLVALSLLYKDNQFFSVEKNNGQLTIKPIISLATSNLFQFS
jgi:hypothetical protein